MTPPRQSWPATGFMLKAGLIYQVSSGVYSYLPLAWRSLRKIEQIIREEMDAAGGQELRLSALQPRELYDESGRTAAFGRDLLTLGRPARPAYGNRPDPRGGPDQDRQGQRQQLQGPARAPLPDPDQVPRRAPSSRRPHPGARVRHEGRLQLRRRRGGLGPELSGDDQGL